MAEKMVLEKEKAQQAASADKIAETSIAGVGTRRGECSSSVSASSGKATVPRKSSSESAKTESAIKSAENGILTSVTNIQASIKKQDEKINRLLSRITDIENYTYE